MKRLVVKITVLAMMLATLGGCLVGWEEDGRGGRHGGYDRDGGHERGRDHDRGGEHDRGDDHDERH